MYFTTAIAVVAGLCLAFGVLYLFVGLKRASDRTLDLLFAFFAFAVAGAVMTARASYLADTAQEFIAPYRMSLIFAAVALPLLAWYVAAYTGARPRVLLWLITGGFAVWGLSAAFSPDLVVDASAGLETMTLPWGEVIRVYPAGTSTLFPVAVAAQLGLFGYVVAADIVQFRAGQRRKALILAVGVGWLILTLVAENLALSGLLELPPLADFSFLGFVLAFSLAMASDAIEAEEELLDYRSNLEAMVDDRTARLEDAQALLLKRTVDEAEAAERSRLARDLHDGVTQLLFSINLVAGSLGRLWRSDPEMAERSTGELQRLTRGALAEMRTLLRELRPQTIADTELGTLVSHLASGLAARHDIPADVQTDVVGELPPEVHIALYRVAQEAMNNVAKHANASNLTVLLSGTSRRVRLSISDDGIGCEPDAEGSGSMGLAIMRERADGIGADFAIRSSPGAGTTVDVTWGESHA